jgi:hypothetical protein
MSHVRASLRGDSATAELQATLQGGTYESSDVHLPTLSGEVLLRHAAPETCQDLSI